MCGCVEDDIFGPCIIVSEHPIRTRISLVPILVFADFDRGFSYAFFMARICMIIFLKNRAKVLIVIGKNKEKKWRIILTFAPRLHDLYDETEAIVCDPGDGMHRFGDDSSRFARIWPGNCRRCPDCRRLLDVGRSRRNDEKELFVYRGSGALLMLELF